MLLELARALERFVDHIADANGQCGHNLAMPPDGLVGFPHPGRVQPVGRQREWFGQLVTASFVVEAHRHHSTINDPPATTRTTARR